MMKLSRKGMSANEAMGEIPPYFLCQCFAEMIEDPN